MAELVTSESRRYLHGIQNTIISDDDTGVALNVIPSDSQLALVDKMEVDGTLTVYGDAYVIASGSSPTVHNALPGRSDADAHPASSITNTPAGNIAATTVQAAINELDSEKVAANAAITGAAKTKITYDSKGLVTSGADATASEIANTPAAPITSTNVQGALNEVASLANSASSAASTAQSTANSAASAAAYADALARSSHNLVKNANSEDANPTGYEAAGVVYDHANAYAGNRCRKMVAGGSYASTIIQVWPCAPGESFYATAWCKTSAGAHINIQIRFLDADGINIVGSGVYGASTTSTSYVQDSITTVTAPAGATSAVMELIVYGGTGNAYWDCLYATRKISAGMLEANAIQSTTSNFSVTSVTASTSTTTGAIVVSGGVGCADYFTGKYRSSDGSAGLTATRTFYAASSSGGATNVLNTVTIKDGIITSWTQA